MPDGSPLIIGGDNIASVPGAETLLRRDVNSARNDPVFTARTPVAGHGIYGECRFGFGVYGTCTGGGLGVYGTCTGAGTQGFGVVGTSTNGNGVVGTSTNGTGVSGTSDTGFAAVTGDHFGNGIGVLGSTITNGTGVVGTSTSGVGVQGTSDTNFGVTGTSTSGSGVQGTSYTSGSGVVGTSTDSNGVVGTSTNGPGVRGDGLVGVWAEGDTSVYGIGDALFIGNLVGTGVTSFQIDHPLDPENRYLLHACVESSEMKNVYDGVARLDEDGAAWVELPDWFEALNGDFRYQLTAVGGPAPGLHVAEEISENRFKIAGGEEGIKVCWQVTGSRKDPWAAANPFEVEQEKREEDRGRYLQPNLYDAPEEQRVILAPIAEAVAEEQPSPEPSGIDFARLQEAHRRQLDELGRLVEEQRQEMEELRRRMERPEEAPPEST
jgi:hypothetical protein